MLGLDHQHNMHDRDSYLHIRWDQLSTSGMYLTNFEIKYHDIVILIDVILLIVCIYCLLFLTIILLNFLEYSDLQNKLPPAASLGFPYDYQSVMHYPWLKIENGVSNIMYPIWVYLFFNNIYFIKVNINLLLKLYEAAVTQCRLYTLET